MSKRKFGNKKCSMVFQHQTYEFDSKAEMNHFAILSERLRRFEIEKLKLQPSYQIAEPFKIDTDKTKSGTSRISRMIYTPDFEYYENGKKVAVEVKGMETTAYKMRFKLFLISAYEKYGIDTFIVVNKGKETTYDCRSVQYVS